MKVKYKRLSAILSVFIVVFAFLFSAFSFKVDNMKVKADEGVEIDTFDLAEYPSANIMPYPYYTLDGTVSNGVMFDILSDGSVNILGTSTSYQYYIIAFLTPDRFSAGTYYVGQSVVGSSSYVRYYIDCLNGSTRVKTVFSGYGGSFVLDYSNYDRVRVSVYLSNGASYDGNYKFNLLRGSTVYPYLPPVGLIKSLYFNNGLLSASAGYFYNATLDVMIEAYVDEDQSALSEVYFAYPIERYLYGGFSFKPLSNYIIDDEYASFGWTRTFFTLNLEKEVLLSNFSLYGEGNSTSFFGTVELALSDGSTISCSWVESGDGWLLEIPDEIEEGLLVLSLSTFFGGGFDGLAVSWIDPNTNYYAGYSSGYNEGYSNGSTHGVLAGREEGKEIGYKDGYCVGYDEGYTEGLNHNNTFLSLMFAVVDAPVSVFSSMLDFEILGYNMRNFALCLLSCCLLIACIRLFTGGK